MIELLKKKDGEIQHFFIDQLTSNYNITSSDKVDHLKFVWFAFENDENQLIKSSTIRNRVLTINNNADSLKIKSLKISNGLFK